MHPIVKFFNAISNATYDLWVDLFSYQPKFTIPASQCPFFPILEHCPSKLFIDLDRVLNEAEIHIEEWTHQKYKIPPLIYSRTARGGKTTFLHSLYNQLTTHNDYSVIAISFNGGVQKYFKPGDSTKNKLLRAIASKFFQDISANELWTIDEDQLLQHIESTRNGHPVVLLIDELNILGCPLDFETTDFLRRNFLDKYGRMLVFTTHVPMGVRELSHLMGGIYDRDIIVLSPPTCFDLSVIQTLERCESVTPAELSFYGGIPSLIYAVRNLQYNPVSLFEAAHYTFSAQEEAVIIPAFVVCVLTGYRYPCLSQFERFSTQEKDQRIRFPLVYIYCICSLFGPLRDHFTGPFNALLNTYGTEVGSGTEWGSIIIICILFRALYWKYHNSCGPLNIGVGYPKHNPNEVEFGLVILSSQCTSPAAAHDPVFQQLNSMGPGCYLIVTQHTCFSVYDGFICLKLPNNVTRVYAYQAKADNEIPAPPKEMNDWIVRGFLLRGKPIETPKALAYWQQYSRLQMIEFLGYSLNNLLPLYFGQDM